MWQYELPQCLGINGHSVDSLLTRLPDYETTLFVLEIKQKNIRK